MLSYHAAMYTSRLYRLTAIYSALFLHILVSCAAAQSTPVRMDSSDWWSYTRQEELPQEQSGPPVNFQNRRPEEKSFQIAGIGLRETWDFSVVRSKFGDSTEVQRGD